LYHIDLTTILCVFAHQSGKLDTDLRRVPGVKEHCHAQLFLAEGKVVSCIIEGKSGVWFSGEDALRMLQSVGILEWTYTPTTQTASRPAVSTQLSPILQRTELISRNMVVLFPVRTRRIEQQEFASWSRWQRSVYNLIDGRKSTDDIARVLAQPQERIREILSELQKQGVITLLAEPHSQ